MINPTTNNGAAFAGLRIGLLGGSFNPAHQGHLEMSRFALKRLELDQLWWLVSPQNPLKSTNNMKPLVERLASAQTILTPESNILATDLETQLGVQYTIDTLRALRQHFDQTRFVWLMGADNLAEIHLWRDWTAIFSCMPIAVFRRAGYDHDTPASSKALQRFAAVRQTIDKAPLLATLAPPAWLVLDNPFNSLSATEIRKDRLPNERTA